MSRFQLSAEQITAFHRDGYLLVPDLFDEEEMRIVRQYAKNDPALNKESFVRKDGGGGETKLALWNEAGDDLYGLLSRSERIVEPMTQLMGDEIYHWHHKMTLKEPRVGGAWEWHQDYGYWYDMGCLFPDMGSAMLAVDPANKANGCLQVLKGGHKLGRINHVKIGEQTGADPERTAAAEKQMELVYCEIEPGTAIFFHGNTLHRSDQNTSDKARWALICCYNTRHNDPYKITRHPAYTKLDTVGDDAIRTYKLPAAADA